jgi:Icc-related predicted phosphoesterase
MWLMAFQVVPWLLMNKIRYGRFLDILVTHTPPWGIHDQEDLPHQGAKAFNWLIRTFHPGYHLHGHIHVYSPSVVTETQVMNTRVINTFGYRKLEWNPSRAFQTASE